MVAFAAEAHFGLPYSPLRGNGRTGRLLMNLLLLRHVPIAVYAGAANRIDALIHAQDNDSDLSPDEWRKRACLTNRHSADSFYRC